MSSLFPHLSTTSEDSTSEMRLPSFEVSEQNHVRFFLILGLVLGAVLFAVAYWFYSSIWNDHRSLYHRALQKFSQASSLQVTTQFPVLGDSDEVGRVQIITQLFPNSDNLAKTDIEVERIGTSQGSRYYDEPEKFSVHFLIGQKDFYAKVTPPEEVQRSLGSGTNITSSPFNQVMDGKKWLRIDMEDERQKKYPVEPIFNLDNIHLTFAHSKNIEELQRASVLKRAERNVIINDKRYTKLVLGWNKEHLLNLVRALPENGGALDKDEAQVIARIIEKIEGWDQDLVEILINEQNEPSSIVLYLPKIDAKQVLAVLEELDPKEMKTSNPQHLIRKEARKITLEVLTSQILTVSASRMSRTPVIELELSNFNLLQPPVKPSTNDVVEFAQLNQLSKQDGRNFASVLDREDIPILGQEMEVPVLQIATPSSTVSRREVPATGSAGTQQ